MAAEAGNREEEKLARLDSNESLVPEENTDSKKGAAYSGANSGGETPQLGNSAVDLTTLAEQLAELAPEDRQALLDALAAEDIK